MDPAADLRLLLASRYPLLVTECHDEPRLMAMLRRVAGELRLPVWTWTSTRGLARDGQQPQHATADPSRAIAIMEGLMEPGVFVFADFFPFLQNPVVSRAVKEIAQVARPGQTVVLAGSRPTVPPELSDLAVRWMLPPPGHEEVEILVRRTLEAVAAQGVRVSAQSATVSELARAVRGLPGPEAERLIRQAGLRDGVVDDEDVPYLRHVRVEQLGADGILELCDVEGLDLEHVGGMAHLKEWLALRAHGLEAGAERFGLEAPRGILLTGIPGCGKSMLAKALARAWRLPLVLLDPARLYGPFVGESEGRLHDALRQVDAMSPLVLWIDEIEKGFAHGGADDGGVSRRILGTFLRWLQDRPPGVFVAATCNQVADLPPELLRKGRFDEVFFVDLPTASEREDIFAAHLAHRHREPGRFDLAALGAASEGFSGAEIEAAVVGALYRAYASGGDLTTEALLEELRSTAPLSRTRAEDVERLRAWARGRAVPA